MARSRRKDDATSALAPVAGALAMLFMLFPQAFLGLLILVVVLMVGFVFYRVVTRRSAGRDWSTHAFIPAPVTLAPETKFIPPPRVSAPPARQYQVPEPPSTTELIKQLRAIDWFQFEKVVARVYRNLGYDVARRGGANPDGGIDLIIERDGQRTAVQCKQWKTWNVGVKSVREFLGALTHAAIQKGIFITLRGYTGEAKALADEHGIEIVNETGLARMLEAAGAGFDPETMDILSDRRKFCPKCEREMVLKTATKGRGAGQQFWACPGYPRKCRYTMPF